MIESLGKIKDNVHFDKRPVDAVKPIPGMLNKPSFTSNISYNGKPLEYTPPRDMYDAMVKDVSTRGLNTTADVIRSVESGNKAASRGLDVIA